MCSCLLLLFLSCILLFTNNILSNKDHICLICLLFICLLLIIYLDLKIVGVLSGLYYYYDHRFCWFMICLFILSFTYSFLGISSYIMIRFVGRLVLIQFISLMVHKLGSRFFWALLKYVCYVLHCSIQTVTQKNPIA